MTRVLEFLIALVIVVLLFVLVGVFLPDTRHVEHSGETNHPIRQVYDTINSFKRFGEWHPLRLHDPQIQYRLEGPERGVGARLNYVSQKADIGSGNWEIVNSQQDSQVEFAINNESYGENKTSVFLLDQQGKTVSINWQYDVSYGWDLFGRYAGLYVGRNVGDDMKIGLNNLIGLLATMPNYDYASVDVKLVPVQPQNVLLVRTTATRNITAVENAMILALKDIRAAIASNRLEAAGAPRLITTNFGSDKYEFDVAIPVRRPLPGEATADEEPAADDEAAAEAIDGEVEGDLEGEDVAAEDTAGEAPVDMTILPPPAPLEGLNLPSNVVAEISYGGRALTTQYQGHPAALPLVRDMLRSYAAAYGERVHDRSFEEYLTEISDTAAEEARFNVYWPIQ